MNLHPKLPETRIVLSFHDVDFSDLKLPMVCIFKQTQEFPDHYVARIFGVVDGKPMPTDIAMISPAIQGIYEGIPFGNDGFTMRLPRLYGDHPTVVETWI